MKTIVLTAIIKKPYKGNEAKVEALHEALAYYNSNWCNKNEKIYHEIFESEYQGNEVIEVDLKIVMNKSISCELMLKEIRSKVLTLFKKRLVTLVKANGTTIN